MIEHLKKLCKEAIAITILETQARAKKDMRMVVISGNQSEGSRKRVRMAKGELDE